MDVPDYGFPGESLDANADGRHAKATHPVVPSVDRTLPSGWRDDPVSEAVRSSTVHLATYSPKAMNASKHHPLASRFSSADSIAMATAKTSPLSIPSRSLRKCPLMVSNERCILIRARFFYQTRVDLNASSGEPVSNLDSLRRVSVRIRNSCLSFHACLR